MKYLVLFVKYVKIPPLPAKYVVLDKNGKISVHWFMRKRRK